MAVDKLVDSTQLDADLLSVANAIRTKGGTSAQLAFPAGFVSAIDAIPTGGGGTGDELVVDLASVYEWELGAVNGATGHTYDDSKTNNNARLRGATLIKTNNIPFTLSANWGGGEWVVQYAKYDANQKGASSFTVLTSDTVLSTSPYIAIVCRYSNGSTAMNVSDIETIAPKLTINVEDMGLAFETVNILLGVEE